MIIDIKSIFIEQFTRLFENNLGLIAIVFAVAIVVFIFRHAISYNLQLSKRERNNFLEIIILIPLFIVISTTGYLYIKQEYFLLSIGLLVILTYILYIVGIVDMLIEKLEARYGRY